MQAILPTTKCVLRRVRLNQGGYDDSGYYWGQGEPLYYFSFDQDDEEVSDHIRAYGRDDGKGLIERKYKGIKFYR